LCKPKDLNYNKQMLEYYILENGNDKKKKKQESLNVAEKLLMNDTGNLFME
jgi:hypothetical protein